MAYDLIIRNGTIVTEAGPLDADLAIADGKIATIAPEIEGPASETINASGLHLFPGGLDPHIHCNEPGRTEWEGFASATAAMAVGGCTSFIDMPLNAHPPTCDSESFDAKVAAASQSASVDYALWGGLVPGNIDQLEPLAERGVIGFKAFMSTTGTDDFAPADDLTLFRGMQVAARLGKLVAVHAENRIITDGLAAVARSASHTTASDYLHSRPVIAETEAIQRAILFAAETNCSLHIVHVSTGRGVALVAEARSKGLDISCETCPHYLVFSEEDVERIGAAAKCAPPIRPISEVDALWQQIKQGQLSIVASDHSPAPASMKSDPDFFAIWGGIAGCQSTLELMLTYGHFQRSLGLERIATLTAGAAARRFGFWQRKGAIAHGFDADLAIVDLQQTYTLQAEDLQYRHAISPYIGLQLQGRVVQTLLRGQTIQRNGQMLKTGMGRLLRY